jgi:hypothetical protein
MLTDGSWILLFQVRWPILPEKEGECASESRGLRTRSWNTPLTGCGKTRCEALSPKDGSIKSYRAIQRRRLFSGVRLCRTQAADGLSSAETMADSPVTAGVSNGQPRRNT